MSLHSHFKHNTSLRLLSKTKPDQSKINDNKPEFVQETTDVTAVKKDDAEDKKKLSQELVLKYINY